jgi:hypothetical protein
MVARLRRAGVSQVQPRVCSQVRARVALAAAVMADAAHMRASVGIAGAQLPGTLQRCAPPVKPRTIASALESSIDR